ncbi:hypothetical protein DIPPA_09731 [Diplonema papillatum]|nr:hypothetical protein DIPPA_09731 [Diplonema papillatum]
MANGLEKNAHNTPHAKAMNIQYPRAGVAVVFAFHVLSCVQACAEHGDTAACHADSECVWYAGRGPCAKKEYESCPSMDVVILFDSSDTFGMAFGAHPLGYAAFLDMVGDWADGLPLAETGGMRVGLVQYSSGKAVSSQLTGNLATLHSNLAYQETSFTGSRGVSAALTGFSAAKTIVDRAATDPETPRVLIFFASELVQYYDFGDATSTFMASPRTTAFAVVINDLFSDAATDFLPLGNMPHDAHLTSIPLDTVPSLLGGICQESAFLGKQLVGPHALGGACVQHENNAACAGDSKCVWYGGRGPCAKKEYMACPAMDIVIMYDGSDTFAQRYGTHLLGYAAFLEMIADWAAGLPLAETGGLRIGLVQYLRSGALYTGLTGSLQTLHSNLRWHDLRFGAPSYLPFATFPVEQGFSAAKSVFAQGLATGPGQRRVVITFSTKQLEATSFGNNAAAFMASGELPVTVFCVGITDSGTDSTGLRSALPLGSMPYDAHYTAVRLDTIPSLLGGLCEESEFLGKQLVVQHPLGDACVQYEDSAACAADSECVWYAGSGPCAKKEYAACPAMDVVIVLMSAVLNFGTKPFGYLAFWEMLRDWADGLPLAGADTAGAIAGGLRVGFVQFESSLASPISSELTGDLATLHSNTRWLGLRYGPRVTGTEVFPEKSLFGAKYVFENGAATAPGRRRVLITFATGAVKSYDLDSTVASWITSDIAAAFSVLINDRFSWSNSTLLPLGSRPHDEHFASIALDGIPDLLAGICNEKDFLGKQLVNHKPAPPACSHAESAACAGDSGCAWYAGSGPCAKKKYAACPALDVVLLFDSRANFGEEFGDYAWGYAAFLDMVGDWADGLPLAETGGMRVGLAQYASSKTSVSELTANLATLRADLHLHELVFEGARSAQAGGGLSSVKTIFGNGTADPGRRRVLLSFVTESMQFYDLHDDASFLASTQLPVAAFSVLINDSFSKPPAVTSFLPLGSLPHAAHFTSISLSGVPGLLRGMCQETEFLGAQLQQVRTLGDACVQHGESTCSADVACVWYAGSGPCAKKAYGACPAMDVVILFDSGSIFMRSFGTHPLGYTAFFEMLRDWGDALPLAEVNGSSAGGLRIGLVQCGSDTTVSELTGTLAVLHANLYLQELSFQNWGVLYAEEGVSAAKGVFDNAVQGPNRRRVLISFVFDDPSVRSLSNDVATFLLSGANAAFSVLINDRFSGSSNESFLPLGSFPQEDHFTSIPLDGVPDLLAGICNETGFVGKQLLNNNTPPATPTSPCDHAESAACSGDSECVWYAGSGPCAKKEYAACPAMDVAILFDATSTFAQTFGAHLLGYAAFLEMVGDWADELPLAETGVRVGVAQYYTSGYHVMSPLTGNLATLHLDLRWHALRFLRGPSSPSVASLYEETDAIFGNSTTDPGRLRVLLMFATTGLRSSTAAAFSAQGVVSFSVAITDRFSGADSSVRQLSDTPHDDYFAAIALDGVPELLGGICNATGFVGKQLVAPPTVPCGHETSAACAADSACVWYDGRGPCAKKEYEACPAMDVVLNFDSSDTFGKAFGSHSLGYAAFLEMVWDWADGLPLAETGGVRVGLVQYYSNTAVSSDLTGDLATIRSNLRWHELQFQSSGSSLLPRTGLLAAKEVFENGTATDLGRRRVVITFATEYVTSNAFDSDLAAFMASTPVVAFGVLINDRYSSSTAKMVALGGMPHAEHFTSIGLDDVPDLLAGICQKSEFLGKQVVGPPERLGDACVQHEDSAACAGDGGCVWYAGSGPCAKKEYAACPAMDVVILFDSSDTFYDAFAGHPLGYMRFLTVLGEWAGGLPLAETGGLRLGVAQYYGFNAISTELTGNLSTLHANLRYHELCFKVSGSAGRTNTVLLAAKDVLENGTAADPGRRRVVVTFATEPLAYTTLESAAASFLASNVTTAFSVLINDRYTAPNNGSFYTAASTPLPDHFTATALSGVERLLAGLCQETAFLGKELLGAAAPPAAPLVCARHDDSAVCAGDTECAWHAGGGLCAGKEYAACPAMDVVVLFDSRDTFGQPFGRHPVGYAAFLEMLGDWADGLPLAAAGGMRVGLVQNFARTTEFTADLATLHTELFWHTQWYRSNQYPYLANRALAAVQGVFDEGGNATADARRRRVLVTFATEPLVLYSIEEGVASFMASTERPVTAFSVLINDRFSGASSASFLPLGDQPHDAHFASIPLDGVPDLLAGICQETGFLGKQLVGPQELGDACVRYADSAACAGDSGCAWYAGSGPCAKKEYAACPLMDIAVVFVSGDVFAEAFGVHPLGYAAFLEMIEDWAGGLPLAETGALRIGVVQYHTKSITTELTGNLTVLHSDLRWHELRFQANNMYLPEKGLSAAAGILNFDNGGVPDPERRRVVLTFVPGDQTNYDLGSDVEAFLASGSVTAFSVLINDTYPGRPGWRLPGLGSFREEDHFTAIPLDGVPDLLAGICSETGFLGMQLLHGNPSPAPEPPEPTLPPTVVPTSAPPTPFPATLAPISLSVCREYATAGACAADSGCVWYKGVGPCAKTGYAACPAMDVVVLFDSSYTFGLDFGAHEWGVAAFLEMVGNWAEGLPLNETGGVRVGLVQYFYSDAFASSLTSNLTTLTANLRDQEALFQASTLGLSLAKGMTAAERIFMNAGNAPPAERKRVVLTFATREVQKLGIYDQELASFLASNLTAFGILINDRFPGTDDPDSLLPWSNMPHRGHTTSVSLDGVPALLGRLCEETSFLGRQLVVPRPLGDACVQYEDSAACAGDSGCVWYAGSGPCAKKEYAACPAVDVVIISANSAAFDDAWYYDFFEMLAEWTQDGLPLSGTGGMRVGLVLGGWTPLALTADLSALQSSLRTQELRLGRSAGRFSMGNAVDMFDDSSATEPARKRVVISFTTAPVTQFASSIADAVVLAANVTAFSVLINDNFAGSPGSLLPLSNMPHTDHFASIPVASVPSLLAGICQETAFLGKQVVLPQTIGDSCVQHENSAACAGESGCAWYAGSGPCAKREYAACPSLDVVIYFDAANSFRRPMGLHPLGYAAFLEMIRDWVGGLPLAGNDTSHAPGLRIGLVQYTSSTIVSKLTGNLTQLYANLRYHELRIASYTYTSPPSLHWDWGFDDVMEVFDEGAASGTERQRVLITFATEPPTVGTSAPAVMATENVASFTVALGIFSNTEGLVQMASSPQDEHFARLKLDDVPALLAGICNETGFIGKQVRAPPVPTPPPGDACVPYEDRTTCAAVSGCVWYAGTGPCAMEEYAACPAMDVVVVFDSSAVFGEAFGDQPLGYVGFLEMVGDWADGLPLKEAGGMRVGLVQYSTGVILSQLTGNLTTVRSNIRGQQERFSPHQTTDGASPTEKALPAAASIFAEGATPGSSPMRVVLTFSSTTPKTYGFGDEAASFMASGGATAFSVSINDRYQGSNASFLPLGSIPFEDHFASVVLEGVPGLLASICNETGFIGKQLLAGSAPLPPCAQHENSAACAGDSGCGWYAGSGPCAKKEYAACPAMDVVLLFDSSPAFGASFQQTLGYAAFLETVADWAGGLPLAETGGLRIGLVQFYSDKTISSQLTGNLTTLRTNLRYQEWRYQRVGADDAGPGFSEVQRLFEQGEATDPGRRRVLITFPTTQGTNVQSLDPALAAFMASPRVTAFGVAMGVSVNPWTFRLVNMPHAAHSTAISLAEVADLLGGICQDTAFIGKQLLAPPSRLGAACVQYIDNAACAGDSACVWYAGSGPCAKKEYAACPAMDIAILSGSSYKSMQNGNTAFLGMLADWAAGLPLAETGGLRIGLGSAGGASNLTANLATLHSNLRGEELVFGVDPVLGDVLSSADRILAGPTDPGRRRVLITFASEALDPYPYRGLPDTLASFMASGELTAFVVLVTDRFTGSNATVLRLTSFPHGRYLTATTWDGVPELLAGICNDTTFIGKELVSPPPPARTCGMYGGRAACMGDSECVWYAGSGPCAKKEYEACPAMDVVLFFDSSTTFASQYGAHPIGYGAFLEMIGDWVDGLPLKETGGLRIGLVQYGRNAGGAPVASNLTGELATLRSNLRLQDLLFKPSGMRELDALDDMAKVFAEGSMTDAHPKKRVLITFVSDTFSVGTTMDPDVAFSVAINDHFSGSTNPLLQLASMPNEEHFAAIPLDGVPDLLAGICQETEFLGKQLVVPQVIGSACVQHTDSAACAGDSACVWYAGSGPCANIEYEACPAMDVVFLFDSSTTFAKQYGTHPLGYAAFLEMVADWAGGLPLAETGGVRVGLVQYGDASVASQLTGNLTTLRSNLHSQQVLFAPVYPWDMTFYRGLDGMENVFAQGSATDAHPKLRVLITFVSDTFSVATRMGPDVSFAVAINDHFTEPTTPLLPLGSMPHAEHFTSIPLDGVPELLAGICQETEFLGKQLVGPQVMGDACVQHADTAACAGDSECVWYAGSGPCAKKEYAACPALDVVILFDSSNNFDQAFGAHPLGFAAFLEMIRDWAGGLPLAETGGIRIGVVQYSSAPSSQVRSSELTGNLTTLHWNVRYQELIFEGIHRVYTADQNIRVQAALAAAESMFNTGAATDGRQRVLITFSTAAYSEIRMDSDTASWMASGAVTAFSVAISDHFTGSASLLPVASFPQTDHFTSIPLDGVPGLLAGICTATDFLGKQLLNKTEPAETCSQHASLAACAGDSGCAWYAGKGPCAKKEYAACPAMDVVVLFDSSDTFGEPFGAHPSGFTAFLGMVGDWADGLPLKETGGMRVGLVRYSPWAYASELTGNLNALQVALRTQQLQYQATTGRSVKDGLRSAESVFDEAAGGFDRRRVVLTFATDSLDMGTYVYPSDVSSFLSYGAVAAFSVLINDRYPWTNESFFPLADFPIEDHFTATSLDGVPGLLDGICQSTGFLGKQLVVPQTLGDACIQPENVAACASDPGCAWHDGRGPCAKKAYEACPAMDVVILFDGSDKFKGAFGAHPSGYAAFLEMVLDWAGGLPLAGAGGLQVGVVQFGQGTISTDVTGDLATLQSNLRWQVLNFQFATRATQAQAGVTAAQSLFKRAVPTDPARRRVLITFAVSVLDAGLDSAAVDFMMDPALTAFSVLIKGRVQGNSSYLPLGSFPIAEHFTAVWLDEEGLSTMDPASVVAAVAVKLVTHIAVTCNGMQMSVG